jgi:hypothetical protein
MTVHRVLAGRPQAVHPTALQLSWRAAGIDPRDVEFSIEKSGSPGVAALHVQRLADEARLITTLPEPIMALVRPLGGGTFPDGCRIDLQLSTRGGPATDEFVIPSVDISGTGVTTLFELAPEAGVWTLSVPLVEGRTLALPTPGTPGPLPAVDIDSLPKIAKSAAYRVRELAGPTGQLPPELRAEIQVAVDRSASMLPHARSGARATLLELIVGVNAEVGVASDIPVWQLGRSVELVPTPLSHISNSAYDALLGDVPQTTGTLLAPLLDATAANNERRVVFVITDGAPGDLDDLGPVLDAAQQQGTSTRWHVLAFARSVGDPAVARDPWKDELAVLRPLSSPVFSFSSVTPGSGQDWLAQTLNDSAAGRSAMRQLISGLGLMRGVAR